MLTKQDTYALLQKRGIMYENFDHPPIFTVEEGDRLNIRHGDFDTRSLFLRDRKHKFYYLLTLPCHKELDLELLRQRIGSKRLSFADPDELQKYLGVQRGWVNPLSLLNNEERNVTMVFDASLQGKTIGYHPMANDATIVVSFDDTYKLLAEHGNKMVLCDLDTPIEG
jgi:Ala-tRNA(Pro) deacylase